MKKVREKETFFLMIHYLLSGCSLALIRLLLRSLVLLKNWMLFFALLFVSMRPVESVVVQKNDAVQVQELFIDLGDARIFRQQWGKWENL